MHMCVYHPGNGVCLHDVTGYGSSTRSPLPPPPERPRHRSRGWSQSPPLRYSLCCGNGAYLVLPSRKTPQPGASGSDWMCLHDVFLCCMYKETLNLCRPLVLGPGELQVVKMALPRGLKFIEGITCQVP